MCSLFAFPAISLALSPGHQQLASVRPSLHAPVHLASASHLGGQPIVLQFALTPASQDCTHRPTSQFASPSLAIGFACFRFRSTLDSTRYRYSQSACNFISQPGLQSTGSAAAYRLIISDKLSIRLGSQLQSTEVASAYSHSFSNKVNFSLKSQLQLTISVSDYQDSGYFDCTTCPLRSFAFKPGFSINQSRSVSPRLFRLPRCSTPYFGLTSFRRQHHLLAPTSSTSSVSSRLAGRISFFICHFVPLKHDFSCFRLCSRATSRVLVSLRLV